MLICRRIFRTQNFVRFVAVFETLKCGTHSEEPRAFIDSACFPAQVRETGNRGVCLDDAGVFPREGAGGGGNTGVTEVKLDVNEEQEWLEVRKPPAKNTP